MKAPTVIKANERMRAASAQACRARCAGFSLTELMIAMAIGLGVLAAALTAYLFITKNGRALAAQVAFSDQARVLQSRFTELVELSHHLRIDAVETGAVGPGVEIFMEDDNDSEAPEWIGYVGGGSLATSSIVYRPNGRSSTSEEQVLCTHVGPAYSVAGANPPMFEIVSGHAVLMNIHIGDSDAADAVDDTGPGRQGMAVSIVATSRNQRRKL